MTPLSPLELSNEYNNVNMHGGRRRRRRRSGSRYRLASEFQTQGQGQAGGDFLDDIKRFPGVMNKNINDPLFVRDKFKRDLRRVSGILSGKTRGGKTHRKHRTFRKSRKHRKRTHKRY
jgi:hypothetical protein